MMPALTPADRRDRIPLDLGGQEVVFVRVTAEHYAPEVGGRRLPIRAVRETRMLTEGSATPRWESTPVPQEGEAANIDALVYCLTLDPLRTTVPPHGVRLSGVDTWGHYRQGR